MQYLIILICAFLSCAKVTLQGRLARETVKCTNDSILANCLIFAFTSILFSFSIKNAININIIPYAVLFGILSVSFQVFYALSLNTGPFSITALLVNLNMIIPVVFSIIFFNEELTILKAAGIFLCILALFLNVKSDGRKMNVKWIFYVFLAFVSTGNIAVVQKVFAKSDYVSGLKQFIFFGYLTAFLITLILVLIQKGSRGQINFKVNKQSVLTTLLISACLGAFQYFYTFANSFIDAIVLNPCAGGLATTFQMLVGKIIFGEKFTVREICSVSIGIVAIIIISL